MRNSVDRVFLRAPKPMESDLPESSRDSRQNARLRKDRNTTRGVENSTQCDNLRVLASSIGRSCWRDERDGIQRLSLSAPPAFEKPTRARNLGSAVFYLQPAAIVFWGGLGAPALCAQSRPLSLERARAPLPPSL